MKSADNKAKNANPKDVGHPAHDIPSKQTEDMQNACSLPDPQIDENATPNKRLSFFKTYDCRGMYGADATEKNCFRLGRACHASKRPIVLGMDFREHNDTLAAAFMTGFEGDVRFAGHLPSPALAYASSDGWAISFTASHNPAGYNGVKFKKHQRCFFENELQQLKKKYAFAKAPDHIDAKKMPAVDETVKAGYLGALPEIHDAVFDLAGGAACALKEAFGEKAIFHQPDPTFANHAPEPKEDTLGILAAQTVKQRKVGFAFDGDADRCVAVDQGTVIDGGILTAYIAVHHVQAKTKVFVTLDTQAEVFRLLQDEGFDAHYTPVGDVHIVRAMVEQNAVFAAERSGHYSFKQHMPDSDGIYTAALLSGTKAGDILAFARQFKAISLKDEVRFQVDFAALKAWAEARAGSGNVQAIDGVKADFGDYAFLVRASQTEPKVRINVEAANPAAAKKGLEEVKTALEKSRIS
ncbi:hypothetical protein HYV43_03575 [Candidatus Micrarchaeota archaeon]|nr:hypothetical protein [Candidatus Micrarchaeota archaeon]